MGSRKWADCDVLSKTNKSLLPSAPLKTARRLYLMALCAVFYLSSWIRLAVTTINSCIHLYRPSHTSRLRSIIYEPHRKARWKPKEKTATSAVLPICSIVYIYMCWPFGGWVRQNAMMHTCLLMLPVLCHTCYPTHFRMYTRWGKRSSSSSLCKILISAFNTGLLYMFISTYTTDLYAFLLFFDRTFPPLCRVVMCHAEHLVSNIVLKFLKGKNTTAIS